MKLIFSLATLTFLTSFSAFARPPEDIGNKIKIGMLLPLSGQYAAVGADNQQGIEIAKLEIPNSDMFEFIYADSKADPVQAVLEFRKLLDVQQVAGIFVFRGPAGMAVNSLSKTAKLPLLGGVGNKDFALSNQYAFQLWVRSDQEGEFLANKINERGIKKIAIATVQDDWPVAVSSGFRAGANSNGMQIVFDQEILPSDSDFQTLAIKLKTLGPDAIFLNVGLNQIGPFVVKLRKIGIHAPLYSNFWAGKKEVISALGEAGNGLCFAEMSTDLGNLKSELKNRFNSSPSGATLSAYVATVLFSQALMQMKNDELSAENLYLNLLNQKQVKTQNGIFEIKDRFVHFPMVLRELRDGIIQNVQ